MNKDIKNIIIKAGNLLKKAYSNSQNYKQKQRGHLLSKYDVIINDFLISGIIKLYPDDSIYSEECKEIINRSNEKWIIDPIDGTTCFIFGEPYFAISVAKEINGDIVEAHVYNPVSEEYYYSNSAIKKSYLNDKEIHVSDTSDISDALAAFGFSVNIKAINEYYEEWNDVFENCSKGLAWVCPSLSICNVARGRIEVFIDKACSFEGQSAASLILKNAGGKLLNYDKTNYKHNIRGGIFSNAKIKI